MGSLMLSVYQPSYTAISWQGCRLSFKQPAVQPLMYLTSTSSSLTYLLTAVGSDDRQTRSVLNVPAKLANCTFKIAPPQ